MVSEEPVAAPRASWVEDSALGHSRQGFQIAWLGSDPSFDQPEKGDKAKSAYTTPSTGQRGFSDHWTGP